MKRIVLFVLPVLLLWMQGCAPAVPQRHVITGFGEGTTYKVVYYSDRELLSGRQIDSVIAAFDASCSIYNPNSLITRLNKNLTDSVDTNIAECIALAREVSMQGDGWYDITIKPLVDAWGWGVSAERPDTVSGIDSLLEIVGMDKITVRDGKLIKRDPRVQIDLNSIAKGYSVDRVADYVRSLGIEDFVVEIGGEIYASGRRRNDGAMWHIGIDKPFDGNYNPGEFLQEVLLLEDIAMATSGNYRKFYTGEKGERVHHTINPKTGYSAKNTMLSSTVVAATCAEADAYATLFMVVGIDKAKEILSRNSRLEAYLIYADGDADKVYMTDNMKKRIEK